jgi:ribokinase
MRGEGCIRRATGLSRAADSFAAAVTYFLAHELPVEEGCRRAGPCGAAVLSSLDPLAVQSRLVAP